MDGVTVATHGQQLCVYLYSSPIQYPSYVAARLGPLSVVRAHHWMSEWLGKSVGQVGVLGSAQKIDLQNDFGDISYLSLIHI